MPQLENDAARLKTVRHLLSEALRLADEGSRTAIGAVVAHCIDTVDHELNGLLGELRARSTD